MTDAGAMQLVTIRLKYQDRFDNRSDKADAIWAHIHDEFMKLVENGTLQQTDGRSAQALEKRFNTELGEFRLRSSTGPPRTKRSSSLASLPIKSKRWCEHIGVRRRVSSASRTTSSGRCRFPRSPSTLNLQPGGGWPTTCACRAAAKSTPHSDSDDEEHAFATEEAAEEDRQRRAAEKWAEFARRDDEASNGAEAGRDDAAVGGEHVPGYAGSSSCCSGSAGSVSGSSAPRSTPPPLHVGGATGKSSRKKHAKESRYRERPSRHLTPHPSRTRLQKSTCASSREHVRHCAR